MNTSASIQATEYGTVHSLSARRAENVVPVSVLRAITMINSRYDEPITMNQLAGEVFVSPFHFCRIFAKATGVTPGRYLTAVRMFEAKRLLLTSSLTVSDIVCTVGYSSVGTFTTRFTEAAGMSPSQYRDPEVQRLLVAIAPHFHRLPSLQAVHAAGEGGAQDRGRGDATLTARIELPGGMRPVDLVLGVFAEAIPQCGPVAFTGIQQTGSVTVTLPAVPPGRWLVLAAAEHHGPDGESSMLFGTLRSPMTVAAGEDAPLRLRMRTLRPTDPPIAITLAARSARPTSPATRRRGIAA